MTTEELKARKKALGYTNKMISELSGVPLGTVNKLFGGATSAPRFETLRAIEDVLVERKYKKDHGSYVYNRPAFGASSLKVEESVLATFYNTAKAPGEYTADDYFALPDDKRMELIDGHFYDMAPPLLTHQNVVLSLALLFSECLESHPEKECMLLVSPVGVKLTQDEKTVVEPDIVLLCDLEKLSDPRCVVGAPALLVEVLSPSNKDHDLILKQMLYRNNGVKEYWIVDPETEAVLVYDFRRSELPRSYTMDETVPIGISEGACSIDLRRVRDKLRRIRKRIGE